MRTEKVLFVHDGPRWKDTVDQKYGSFADLELYERYKYLSPEVSLAMRVFPLKSTDGLVNLSERDLPLLELKPFNRPHLMFNYFKSRRLLEAYISSYDIIIARLPSTMGSLAVKICKKLNKPYMVEVVACPFDSLYYHSLLGKMYANIGYFKMKRIVHNAPFVVYVTKEFLESKYPTKGKYVACSNVILNRKFQENPKVEFYNKFLKSKKIVITTTGKVDLTYKGFQYVLAVLPQLIENGYQVHYNIIGGGDQKRLKEITKKLLVSEQVTFFGKLNHDEVFEILERTDLYIQPSETEGLPRAVIEAMSMGCACLGTEVGGIPELLEQDFLFQVKNRSELYKKITQILDKNVLLQQSNRNFRMSQQYEYEVIKEKRNKFYDLFLKEINGK